MEYSTVNYLFAAYLQISEGGNHKITRVEKMRPGKAKFFFRLSPDEAEALQMKFHNSICAEFEERRKLTINLAY